MSQLQSQQKKTSPSVDDAKTSDRRSLVSSRTSPLIRLRFRNPIRSSAAGGGDRLTAASKGQGGCEDRRRRSADSANMSTENEAGNAGTPITTDDLVLEPRVRQYQKHELLQDRSSESGLSEVEAFLLEKQRLMELAKCPDNVASTDDQKDANNDVDDDPEKDKLVPRAPHYVPHPILQVKTETGLTELELYFQQKEAQIEQAATAKVDQQLAADATST